MVKTIIGKNGKQAEIVHIVGEFYRIDMNGETVETMIYGLSRTERKARELVKKGN